MRSWDVWAEGRRVRVSHEGEVELRRDGPEDEDGDGPGWEPIGHLRDVDPRDLPTAAAEELADLADRYREGPSAAELRRWDLEDYYAGRGV